MSVNISGIGAGRNSYIVTSKNDVLLTGVRLREITTPKQLRDYTQLTVNECEYKLWEHGIELSREEYDELYKKVFKLYTQRLTKTLNKLKAA